MDSDLQNIFITGTDTGVGKSVFTSILALSLLQDGKKVCISKPLQTGSPKDTDFLSELTGNKIPVFNTYNFSLPAAPMVSARNEKKEIDINKIILDIKDLEKEFDCVIVEGVGGIAVPITDDAYLVADLIKDLNCPVIIVARPTLGTINHTVLTIEFAKQKNLNLLGFVVSGYDEASSDLTIKTAPEVIFAITKVKCLAKIRKIKNMSHESINSLAEKFASLKYVC